MPLYRCQVSLFTADQPVRDHVVNTFYLRKVGIIGIGENQLPQDIANLWDSTPPITGFNRIQVRLYDMADATPRPIVAQFTKTTTSKTGESGPREVALCLSYSADGNSARRRGRLYMGPLPVGVMAQRPTATTRSTLLTLATGISALGGADVDHVVYSPTTGEDHKVSRAWVDDEWDTQRSRGLTAVARSAVTVSG